MDDKWWTWRVQPGGEGLVTVSACFSQDDFSDHSVGKPVLQKINDAEPCKYTVFG